MASEMHKLWTGGNEGFVSTWYLDPVQIPTIGFGFTWENDVFREWWMAKYGRKFRRGDTISRADSVMLLGLILDKTTLPAVNALMPTAPLRVKEAASDTAYNAGNGSLKWRWAQAFAAGDVKGGAQLLRKTAVTGRGSKRALPGLVRRRAEAATLAETGVFPAWVRESASSGDFVRHSSEDDIRQAQQMLNELGYTTGTPDGKMGPRTKAAVARFQTEHGTLRVDGILGTATMSALVRALDAKNAVKKTVTVGSAPVVVGVTENATDVGSSVPAPVGGGDLGIIGDVLLWGGVALVVGVLVWLAWRHRDELPVVMRRLV